MVQQPSSSSAGAVVVINTASGGCLHFSNTASSAEKCLSHQLGEEIGTNMSHVPA